MLDNGRGAGEDRADAARAGDAEYWPVCAGDGCGDQGAGRALVESAGDRFVWMYEDYGAGAEYDNGAAQVGHAESRTVACEVMRRRRWSVAAKAAIDVD